MSYLTRPYGLSCKGPHVPSYKVSCPVPTRPHVSFYIGTWARFPSRSTSTTRSLPTTLCRTYSHECSPLRTSQTPPGVYLYMFLGRVSTCVCAWTRKCSSLHTIQIPCVRACVRVCVRACVRAHVHSCVRAGTLRTHSAFHAVRELY